MIGDKQCLNCGQNLIDLPGKRVKVFCNNTCRSNYWQKSDRLSKQGKSDEEIVTILSQQLKLAKKKIAENNKPENKKRIEKERNTVSTIPEKHKNSQPIPETDCAPPPPVRKEGESSIDFAFRKSEWKRKNQI